MPPYLKTVIFGDNVKRCFVPGTPFMFMTLIAGASTDATEKETTTILSGWIIVQL